MQGAERALIRAAPLPMTGETYSGTSAAEAGKESKDAGAHEQDRSRLRNIGSNYILYPKGVRGYKIIIGQDKVETGPAGGR